MDDANLITLKVCTRCKTSKSVLGFCKDKTRSDGLFPWCNDCKKQKRAEHYEKNKTEIMAKVDRWRKANWETLKPKVLEYRHRRMAAEKNAAGSHTANDVQSILRLQRYKCACCGISLKSGFHVDHVVPLSRGGSNDKFNLQMLCATCNLRKSNKDPIQWAQQIGRLV